MSDILKDYNYNLGLYFQHIAVSYSERPALRYPDGQIVTYWEFNVLANRIAQFLHQQGLKRRDVVGLFNDKSPVALAAMVACLKLGIIYTNLDPDSPSERIHRILGICQPRLIFNSFPNLSFGEQLEKEWDQVVVSCYGDDFTVRLTQFPEVVPNSVAQVTGADPAYLMFTSGSTGFPKGVVISHGNVLNFIAWSQERFEIRPDDVLSNVNPIYFDNSVFDFYSALFSGATLVPVTPQEAKEPRQVVKIVNQQQCTIWFSVPSLLVYLLTTRSLSSEDFPAVRKIIFGGEGFPKPKLKQLYDLFGHRADLENVYGPTECTCICSAYTISNNDFVEMQRLAPLGTLAPNFDFEILPLDDGDRHYGELFLLGSNVGLGYYNNPERMAQSFIQNPRHNLYREIGYKTGDLVHRDETGLIHFKGRADFQVKHMGYRIELEEIEAALNSLPAVNESAVIYHKLGEGLGQIIAYASLAVPESPEFLLQVIATILPSYMMPKRLLILDSLPKNQNGKVDRAALQTSQSSKL